MHHHDHGNGHSHTHDHSHDHDHAHAHGHGIPRTGGRMALVILFNLVITAAEYIGGIFSGSLALIADAGHNLSDVLSLALGFAGERVSARKPDETFSFGLKRFEVLVALVNSLSLLVIGGYIVYEAVGRYLNPVPVRPGVMLPVAAIGLAGNVLSIMVLGRDRNANINMRAAFMHLFYDALSSIAVIAVGIVLVYRPLYILDLAASLLIAIMIAWSSMDIIRESLRIILQGAPRGLDTKDVYDALLTAGHVAGVHGLHIWSINSREVFLSCHITLREESSDADTNAVISGVNDLLESRFGITHTTIQVETSDICGKEPGSCCR